MATDRIGDCNGCGALGVRIVAGWATRADKRCILCESARRRAKSKPMKKGVTFRQKRLLVLDRELNMAIWADRPHACIECGRRLEGDPARHKEWFSHLLPKGAYPRLRHDPANIVLHCMACHREWGAGDYKSMRTFALHSTYMRENGFTK